MNSSDSVLNMRQAITRLFPEEAATADAHLREGYYGPDAHFLWLEKFSQSTTHAMAARDQTVVEAHLKFISNQLEHADDELRAAIDVAYVESLMWNLDSKGKRWAWRLIPTNLKHLYIETWGKPRK